nr:PREDICTED: uncharacterized protein LOC109037969 isoform X2 [Bemisia tabaci]
MEGTDQDCEYALCCHLGLEACERTIRAESSNFYQKILGDWVFSVKNETKISMNCDGEYDFKWLRGAGVLKGSGGCELGGDGRLMLGGSSVTSMVKGDWWTPRSPEGSELGLISGKEKEEIRLAGEEGDLLQRVQACVRKAKGDIQLSTILGEWKSERASRPWITPATHMWSLSAAMMVFSVVALGVVGRLCCFLKKTVDLDG